MKRLSMILTMLLVIFGSSAVGHTSDECVLFEGTFEKMSKKPMAQLEYFQALDSEAILKVYDESNGQFAKKDTNVSVSVNGKKMVRSWDFCNNRFFGLWHWHQAKEQASRYSHVKPQDDYIEKTVKLFKGRNSLGVKLDSMRTGKIRVVIVKPKYLGSDDVDCDLIEDSGYDEACTGGNTNLCNDNCPDDFNPDQADSDGDGFGDVCDNEDGYPNKLVATVGVGPLPRGGIAVSPNGDSVYVSNMGGDGKVSVIKTSDNSVGETILVGGAPWGVSVDPDGEFVYVVDFGSSSVSVIDAASNQVVDTIPVGSYLYPIRMAIAPGGELGYVNNFAGNSVSVVDLFGRQVLKTITVGSRPVDVSISRDGAFVYVSNSVSGTVSVIDTVINDVVGTILVPAPGSPLVPEPGSPAGISITPNGNRIYVNNNSAEGTVSVFDTVTYELIKTIKVGSWPDGSSMTPSGAYVYVNNSGDDTVSIIDTASNEVIETIGVGTEPRGGIAVSPDGKFVYVANYVGGDVSVIGF